MLFHILRWRGTIDLRVCRSGVNKSMNTGGVHKLATARKSANCPLIFNCLLPKKQIKIKFTGKTTSSSWGLYSFLVFGVHNTGHTAGPCFPCLRPKVKMQVWLISFTFCFTAEIRAAAGINTKTWAQPANESGGLIMPRACLQKRNACMIIWD